MIRPILIRVAKDLWEFKSDFKVLFFNEVILDDLIDEGKQNGLREMEITYFLEFAEIGRIKVNTGEITLNLNNLISLYNQRRY